MVVVIGFVCVVLGFDDAAYEFQVQFFTLESHYSL